jgi:hypothetical protein
MAASWESAAMNEAALQVLRGAADRAKMNDCTCTGRSAKLAGLLVAAYVGVAAVVLDAMSIPGWLVVVGHMMSCCCISLPTRSATTRGGNGCRHTKVTMPICKHRQHLATYQKQIHRIFSPLSSGQSGRLNDSKDKPIYNQSNSFLAGQPMHPRTSYKPHAKWHVYVPEKML